MECFEPKKLALIRILHILEKYSDSEHPLTQEQIAHYLERDHGIILERKAISRNLSMLKEAGYDIGTVKGGSYLIPENLDDSELRLLVDSVLANRFIEPSQSKSLIESLCAMAGRRATYRYQHMESLNRLHISHDKRLFLNLDDLERAIAQKRKVRFTYCAYKADKKLHPIGKRSVLPIQMVIRNQNYYLIGHANTKLNSRIAVFRIDRMRDLELGVTTEAPSAKPLDYAQYITEHPYMATGANYPQEVVFGCNEDFLDKLIDSFGTDFTVNRLTEERDPSARGPRIRYLQPDLQKGLITVTLNISLHDAIEFACRYPGEVVLLSPQKAQDRIKELLHMSLQTYEWFPELSSTDTHE